jgi:hypothetical protein
MTETMSEDSRRAEQRDADAASQTPTPKLNLRRLESIQRLLQYGAAAALLITLALFVYASFELHGINGKIENANSDLQTQRKEIEKNNVIIESQKSTINSQDKTISVLVNPTQQLSPEQAKEVQQTVEKSVAQTAIENPTGGEKKIAARIYVQIGDEDQRQRASEAVSLLQKKGYIVPGIENVGGKANIPSVSEIRYYQTDDVAQEDIKDIVSLLGGIGVNLRVPKNSLSSSGVRPRHYEIWFGKDFPPGKTATPLTPELPRGKTPNVKIPDGKTPSGKTPTP